MSKSTIKTIAKSSNQQTVNQTAEKLDLVLERYENSLQQSLFGKEIQELVRQGSLAGTDARQQIIIKQKLVSALGNWAFSNPGVLGVYLIPENDSMQSVTTGMKDDDFLEGAKQSEWFSESLDSGRTLWMPDQVAPEAGGPTSLFRMVKSLTGSLGTGYVVVADIKSSILGEELGKISLGKKSVVQLVTVDQRLIATSAPQGDRGYNQIWSVAKTDQEQDSLQGKDAEGKESLTVYSTLGTSGWKLLSVIPVGELTLDANKIMLTTYLSAFIVAILAIAIGF
ncbi:hypothetical protein HMSSN139_20290 [Paenibacillus sp. HMSSN-139]|nr:hypothetical protein HMSSN139_20290 [Paenibacillus sp. HMSSN-139]